MRCEPNYREYAAGQSGSTVNAPGKRVESASSALDFFTSAQGMPVAQSVVTFRLIDIDSHSH
ncbi:hypothetical protein CBM2609_B30009 [Cupriavidus taiwanensis]|nr:hypothetical protein CBM2604_B40009 [Cupriavidus taiwanensis]SOZ32317.1 hypothetical protein CBM2609_B30009 [Cupriavidus taiwanensis]